MTGATGMTGDAESGCGAMGFSSGLPHVMQKRMPGAFCAPQRPHFVPSTGTGAAAETGGCGTPIGGVGGAMRG
jgi:hypothetical protein